jgi:hypothetical protein
VPCVLSSPSTNLFIAHLSNALCIDESSEHWFTPFSHSLAEEQSLPEVTLTVRSWPKGIKGLNYRWRLSNPAPQTIEASLVVAAQGQNHAEKQRGQV